MQNYVLWGGDVCHNYNFLLVNTKVYNYRNYVHGCLVRLNESRLFLVFLTYVILQTLFCVLPDLENNLESSKKKTQEIIKEKHQQAKKPENSQEFRR